jgi:hypothetical protein
MGKHRRKTTLELEADPTSIQAHEMGRQQDHRPSVMGDQVFHVDNPYLSAKTLCIAEPDLKSLKESACIEHHVATDHHPAARFIPLRETQAKIGQCHMTPMSGRREGEVADKPCHSPKKRPWTEGEPSTGP